MLMHVVYSKCRIPDLSDLHLKIVYYHSPVMMFTAVGIDVRGCFSFGIMMWLSAVGLLTAVLLVFDRSHVACFVPVDGVKDSIAGITEVCVESFIRDLAAEVSYIAIAH